MKLNIMKLSMKHKTMLMAAGLTVLFTAGVAQVTSATSAKYSVVPATIADQSDGLAEPAGLTTYTYNHHNSAKSVNTATGRDGKGTREAVRPGKFSTYDTDSVYIYWIGQREGGVVCNTWLNGNKQSKRVWVNTKWWRQIGVEIYCHR